MENVDFNSQLWQVGHQIPRKLYLKKSIKHDCCGSEAKRTEQMKDGSKAEVNKVCWFPESTVTLVNMNLQTSFG